MSDPQGNGAMFTAIARKYDRLNRVTSLGFDARWRRAAVEALSLSPGARVLDLAAGTADLSIAIARRYTDSRICALDPSVGMLRSGIDKIMAAGLTSRISPVLGVAERLPFPDDTFDAVIIGFGVRNFSNRSTALKEIRRVLRDKGRLVILELSMPGTGVLAPLARFYINRLVPLIGRLLSSGSEYEYLAKSIAAFPSPTGFSAELEREGFCVNSVRPFMGAACQLFAAEVSDA